jgi:hypothetical protein
MAVTGTSQFHIDLKEDVYVPVAVDAEREMDGHLMVRATYFVVTTSAPGSIWEIELPPLAPLDGVGAVGLVGVVFSALRPPDSEGSDAGFDLFSAPEDVAAIFALEEDAPLVTVQFEDTWFPYDRLAEAGVWDGSGPANGLPKRGDVYRVGLSVFQDSYRYSAQDISLDQFLDADWDGQILYSPAETAAIRAWSQSQIDKAKAAYKDKEVKLQSRTWRWE